MLSRRGLIAGLFCAPAIVRASSLMSIKSFGEEEYLLTEEMFNSKNSLLTLNMITREAVRLWKNSNQFIMNIDRQSLQQPDLFGASLQIQLPADFCVK